MDGLQGYLLQRWMFHLGSQDPMFLHSRYHNCYIAFQPNSRRANTTPASPWRLLSFKIINKVSRKDLKLLFSSKDVERLQALQRYTTTTTTSGRLMTNENFPLFTFLSQQSHQTISQVMWIFHYSSFFPNNPIRYNFVSNEDFPLFIFLPQ